ncbi:MAG: lipopolysaccharide transport periplasmic protein LptA [Pikeienuella sp.]
MSVKTFAASTLAACLVFTGAAFTGVSADTKSPFGGFRHDETQPIEIAADSLEVREADGIVIFTGAVDAGQGTLRLTSNKLTVTYGDGGAGSGEINKMRAEGSVFIANGAETASGDWAEYNVAGGVITMGGAVTLTQGGNVVKGGSLKIDLNTGQGAVDGAGGRVKSVFTPAKKSD